MLAQEGYLTIEELKAAKDYPSQERFGKGPVAVIECIQEIPCNPCEMACKFGAIEIGSPITKLPRLDEEKCKGCGLCVPKCPGLAIFVIDKTYSEKEGTVSFPYEYLPLPEKGQCVEAVDRKGKSVCIGTVVDVKNIKSFDRTAVVTLAVPKELTDQVRGIRRGSGSFEMDDDMLVCRCEEVTLGEIREAIRQGARDVTGVKRRTRAGMGLCQGRTCERLVQQILRQELGGKPEEIGANTARPPLRPVTFASLCGGEEEQEEERNEII
ncbi:MAG: (2Fe-2S)-binding protein [Bacillota bacterium]|nr:(2Fe-2S)-binding protein [Bacillota bacterium]